MRLKFFDFFLTTASLVYFFSNTKFFFFLNSILIMARTRSKTNAAASPASSKVTKPAASPKVSKTKASPKAKASPKVKASPKAKQTPEKKEQESSIIPEKVLNKAISELKKFNERQQEAKENDEDKKLQLFDNDQEDEESFYLTIESKKFFSSKPQFKPKSIRLSKSIHPESTSTCLIIRDEFIKTDEMLEQLENETDLKINEFVPLKIVKNEYKNFEKRREFHSKFDFFLVDESILSIMPNALGKIFYQSKKFPIPIKVSSLGSPKELSLVTLKNQVNKALSSTSYLPPIGTNISVKIGFINYDTKDLIENINDVVKTLDINEIKSIHLKSTTSPALPLFYTDSLYSENDVAKEEEQEEEETEGKLTAFEEGLLELGDAEEVAKVIGKKLGEKKKKNNKIKPAKGKVSKK